MLNEVSHSKYSMELKDLADGVAIAECLQQL